MAKRTGWRVLLLLLGLWLVPAVPARADIILTDPVGDTFNTGTIDIVSYGIEEFSGAYQVRVFFGGAISAPSALAPNSVVGFIDLDTDRNAATGGTAPFGGAVTGGNSWINFFIPPNPGTPAIPGPLVALGDEFYVDLGSELSHSGLVDVVDSNTNLSVGTATITYGASSFSITIPKSFLGVTGDINYGILVGDFNSPTDRAPNGANPSVSATPGPSTLVLAGAAGAWALGCGCLRRLRKRA